MIRELTNQDPQFYELMGPYLANRMVVKELGSPVWDDSDKRWTVAVDEHGVTGFVSVAPRSFGYLVASFYVERFSRGRGVGSELLGALSPVEVLRTVAAPMSVGVFTRAGFVETGTRGRFTLMCRGA